MNCYTLTAPGQLSAGIELTEAGAVRIGEAGRGRVQVDVPVPAGAVTRPARPVPAGDDPDPRNTAILVSVPGDHRPAGSVVVAIRDHSGYRGGWYLRAARSPEAWVVFRAVSAAHDETLRARGEVWHAHQAASQVAGGPHGEYYHTCPVCLPALERAGAGHADTRDFAACPACCERSAAGQFGPHKPGAPDVPIIAQGECAQGAAGRMGGGPEYLIIMEPGQAIEVVRTGRLYGQPGVLRLANEAGTITVTDPEEIAHTAAAAARW